MCTRHSVFVNHKFEAFRAVKLIQHLEDNFKGFSFLNTLYTVVTYYESTILHGSLL